MRELSMAQAIREALYESMLFDPKVVVFGLGVNDPKRIFETTDGLVEQFGNDRVFDVPIAENSLTGMAIGLADSGYRPVLVHQRLDFSLVSIDQIVNSAAKWSFMFGPGASCPLVLRMIVGRGWGQGPTHAQALHAWFAHIPGLKVVMPAFPSDAKALLIEAIADDNPVLFIEHRWLHGTRGDVQKGLIRQSFGVCNVVRRGKDITLVACSFMVLEALRVAEWLDGYDITCEVLDLRTISPLDMQAICESAKKTKNVIVLDIGYESFSIASEICFRVVEACFEILQNPPRRLGMKDKSVPTSHAIVDDSYPDFFDILTLIEQMLRINVPRPAPENGPRDVPGAWFRGPF